MIIFYFGRGFWVKGIVCRGFLWLEVRGFSIVIEVVLVSRIWVFKYGYGFFEVFLGVVVGCRDLRCE